MKILGNQNYPLIDLHIHLDGSLTLDIVEELLKNLSEKEKQEWNNLLKIKKIDWTKLSLEQKKNMLSVSPNCTTLDEYLNCFDFPCSLLQTPESVRKATYFIANKQQENGVTYFEPRFAVAKFSENYRKKLETKNLSEKKINKELYKYEIKLIKAIRKGLRDAHIYPKIILCTMRNHNWGLKDNIAQSNNLRTIKLAKQFKTSLDLAGGEKGNSNTEYEIFQKQGRTYTDLIVHSGEAGSLEEKLINIETAINHGTKRIGHGVALACVYDSNTSEELKKKAISLIKQIKEKNIFLEICPTSNYQTQAVSQPHPVVKMVLGDETNGIPSLMENITINTDNPSVSNTTLKREYEIVKELLDATELSQNEKEKIIYTLHLNSVNASYMPLKSKAKYKNAIEKIYQKKITN